MQPLASSLINNGTHRGSREWSQLDRRGHWQRREMQPGSCTGPGWSGEPGLSWPPPRSRTASERPLDWGWWGRRPGRRDSRSAGTRPLVCWWLLASLSPEIINPIICFSTDHWHHQQHNYIFSLNTDRYYDRNCTHFLSHFWGIESIMRYHQSLLQYGCNDSHHVHTVYHVAASPDHRNFIQ